LAMGPRQRLLGLQRVVDDDDVRTPSGQHPADRGRDPAALGRRLELGHRLTLRREPGREQPPVPVAGDDAAAIAREFVGEVLGIADAEDLQARVMAETPGRKGDRGQVRLQVAGWYATISRRIRPSRTAISFAARTRMYQCIAMSVRGLSSI